MSFPGSSRQWLKFDLNHRPSLEKGLSERQVFWRLNDDPKWLLVLWINYWCRAPAQVLQTKCNCDAHDRAIFKATSEFDFMSCLCWFVLYLCAAHFCCTIVFKCAGLCHCTLNIWLFGGWRADCALLGKKPIVPREPGHVSFSMKCMKWTVTAGFLEIVARMWSPPLPDGRYCGHHHSGHHIVV